MSVKKNFSSRLSLYVLLVSAGLMIVLTAWLSFLSISLIRSNARATANLTLDNSILEIEKVITEVERAVDNLDWVLLDHLDDESFIYTATRELVDANPSTIGSAVAFEPGYYKCRPYISPRSPIWGTCRMNCIPSNWATKTTIIPRWTGTRFPNCWDIPIGASRTMTTAAADSGSPPIPCRFGTKMEPSSAS